MSWNRRVFDDVISRLPGDWHFVGDRQELTGELCQSIDPRFIFFLHWSWKVPAPIIDGYECVCFHMTDVPYGRGGSPLQNLIARGHRTTKLTALRMVEDFDAGPVYLKEDLDLGGSAEEIYIRSSLLSAQMIERIINDLPEAEPQQGEAVSFARRKPEQSEITADQASLMGLFDHIRMLDAPGYPKAYVSSSGFRLELSHATLRDGKIEARVVITRDQKG